jgi:putative phosphoesterase
MTTIGVISDTHIKVGGKRQLPPHLFQSFAGVDLILHAGDLNIHQVITDLETIAPVLAVHGNNDDWEVLHRLPQTREFKIEEVTIGLTHGDIGFGTTVPAIALSHFPQADCVVFGHSHMPRIEWKSVLKNDGIGREVLLFNPGSATKKRRAPQHSCGILRIDGRHIDAELITWD